MIVISEFAAADADAIDLQPMQAADRMAGAIYENGPGWTVRDGDGRILACLGFLLAGPSYRIAWAMLALGKRNALVPISRTIRRLLDGAGWNRVEMLTHADFAEAARWAELLGFELEGVKRKALPDGGDLLVWARIAKGEE
ncbi:hypothetical protein M9978_08355 [Sphingomonas sp. MG17]|uniref:N-acetyltransferase domain-containing protein n=1 Tax=Sphingomonas tagetis TaxID=2949092 RepID=A0A9X2HJV5_9SPHN|nr:hypothetical protein [Sphingomonas tagetis]MCP3730439.1 hypothetical protein [Sphingomonas tagetis]